MVRTSLLGIVVLLATEARAAEAPRQPAFDEHELVSGAVLELAPLSSPLNLPTRDQVFELDAEMQAFLAPLAGIRDPRHKLLALTEALEQHGMFSREFAEVTRTAKATFHDRQGNCLSFTMLFVALARAAGLTASYQSVQVQPTWANDGQVVIASHVNAVVRTAFGEETVVDFNIRAPSGDEASRRISDTYALGLFYTNLGAEALLRGEYTASLAYLREAARVYPKIAGLWVNLGVLYSRHRRYEHAEAAYLRALEIDEDERSALANLVVVYDALGEPELAQVYRERVRGYRERNPYYHYSIAARAYERRDFEEALAALRKAVRLKPDEHEFYTLRGRAFAAIGKPRDAEQSFERAREYEAIEYARRNSQVRLGGLSLP